jgi:S1-C subfamily serine protease
VVLILRVTGSETSIGGGGFVSQEGFVVTNWHVVEGAHRVGVWLKYNTPSISAITKDNVIIGEVTAVDQARDLALIRLTSAGQGIIQWRRIKPLDLGDFSQVKIGQDVFAIGHPKKYLWSYNEGVVSQIRPGHSWRDEDGNNYQATLIQTQTPLSPGSSGAPLFDAAGKVIGITSAVTPEAQNLNFAIAVNEIQDFLRRASRSR